MANMTAHPSVRGELNQYHITALIHAEGENADLCINVPSMLIMITLFDTIDISRFIS